MTMNDLEGKKQTMKGKWSHPIVYVLEARSNRDQAGGKGGRFRKGLDEREGS